MLFDRTDATPEPSLDENAAALSDPSESSRIEPEPVPIALKVSRVIPSETVDQYTHNGWRIVRVFENAQRVEASREVLQESHYGNGGHVPAKHAIAFHVINSPTFLVEREEQSITRETKLDYDNNVLRRLVHELRDEVKGLPELKTQIEKSTEQRDNVIEQRNKAEGELAKARVEITRLKAELEKVRREIGDGRWREIGGWMGDGPMEQSK